MSLSATIKSIQAIMRTDTGVDGDAQRIGQLVWMFFLKIYDDKETEHELLDDYYKSPIPEALRWRNWAADPEGMTGDELLDFVNNQLFPTLKNLEPIGNDKRGMVIRGVFEDAYNYMKSGHLMRQVINKIVESIDFNKAQDRHLFGDIYEKILRDLQNAGNAGEYYTPRAVTQFMVDMCAPKLGEKIMDPACGTGGFLTCAIEYVRKHEVKTVEQEQVLQESIFGVEKKPLPHLLCTTNMILHGIDVPTNVRHDNTLSRPLRDYGPRDRVDVIVTNPPFGGMEEIGIESNFPSAYRTRETADLFLVLIMHLLKDGGRAAVVLPDGSLSGDGVKQRIRQKLLEECNVHTIVRLPNSVFKPYATVATNLVFFTKGSPTKDIWYYQLLCPPNVKSYSKTKPIQRDEFDQIEAWWTNRNTSDLAWKASIDEIKANDFDLDIKNPMRSTAGADGTSHEYLRKIFTDIDNALQKARDILEGRFVLSQPKTVTLGEICNLEKGTTPITKAIPGQFSLVTTAVERKSHNAFQFDGEAVCIPLVSSTGHGHASIKRIHYANGKFALGNILVAATPKSKDLVLARYLYFYLNHFKDELIVPLMKGMANVTLSLTSIKTIKIVLPSVQDQMALINLMNECDFLKKFLVTAMQDCESMTRVVFDEIFNPN